MPWGVRGASRKQRVLEACIIIDAKCNEAEAEQGLNMKHKGKFKGAASHKQTQEDGRFCDKLYAEQIKGWIDSGMTKRKTSYALNDPRRYD